MVFNEQRDLVDVIKNFAHFFVHESCGFCTPCRVGGSLLKDLVDKLYNGHATQYDLGEIRNIGQDIAGHQPLWFGKYCPECRY